MRGGGRLGRPLEKSSGRSCSLRMATGAGGGRRWGGRGRAAPYRSLLALHSRMPSMMEAWFNASLSTTSSAPRIDSNRPALASKHDLGEWGVEGSFVLQGMWVPGIRKLDGVACASTI